MRVFGGFAVELERGAAGRQICHFEVTPPDAASPTSAERFHPRFLGGESGGVALVSIGFSLGVGDFALGVDTFEEAAAVAANGIPDARDFAEIDARADNHDPPPGDVMVRRPCITPLVEISASAIF